MVVESITLYRVTATGSGQKGPEKDPREAVEDVGPEGESDRRTCKNRMPSLHCDIRGEEGV